MNTPKARHSLLTVLAVTLIAGASLLSACGNDAEPKLARHEIPNARCDGNLSARAEAGAQARADGRIVRYDAVLDAQQGIRVTLVDDADDAVGTLHMNLVLDGANPADWHADLSLTATGSDHPSSLQRTRILPLADGGVQLISTSQLLNAADGSVTKEARSWTTIGPDGELRGAAIGRPAEAGETEGVVYDRDGRFVVFNTLEFETPEDATRATKAEIDAWLKQQQLEAFGENHDWSLFSLAANDEAWLQSLDVQIRRCETQGLSDKSARMLERSGVHDDLKAQATRACALANARVVKRSIDVGDDVRLQAANVCALESALKDMLTINEGLTTVFAGAGTMLGVGALAIGAGFSLPVALGLGGAMAVTLWATEKAIGTAMDSTVSDNSGRIIGGLADILDPGGNHDGVRDFYASDKEKGQGSSGGGTGGTGGGTGGTGGGTGGTGGGTGGTGGGTGGTGGGTGGTGGGTGGTGGGTGGTGGTGGGSSGSGGGSAKSFGGTGGSTGDPHIVTLDGLKYDFQTVGEFVVLKSTTPTFPFEVQARQIPLSGICSNVSFNTAFAMKVGGSVLHVSRAEQGVLRVDGVKATFLAGLLHLPNGVQVERLGVTRFTISWPDGGAIEISHGRNIAVRPSPAWQNNVQGLLGNYNGDPQDDLQFFDGTVVQQPVDWTTLVTDFADAWRVDSTTSLFEYDTGKDTDDYTVLGFPSEPMLARSLPDAEYDDAKGICMERGVSAPSILEDCILDVACSGDPTFADSHAKRNPSRETLAEVTGMIEGEAEPIDLSDWKPSGKLFVGSWDVSGDGTTVTQSEDDDRNPAFFISAQNHQNIRLTGTIEAMGSPNFLDDLGFMGIAFGLKAPIDNASGADVMDLESFLFTWKKWDSDFTTVANNTYVADAGMTLMHVDATLTDQDRVLELLWDNSDGVLSNTPGREILSTKQGAGSTWERGVSYEFELVYTDDLIKISIDGTPVFSRTQANVSIPLEAGRIGFYTFNLGEVKFSNFRLGPVE